MILPIVLASLAGVLVGVSRQVNGRLSLSTSPLVASFWNHLVGFAALTALGVAIGGLIPAGAAEAPWHAYVGGTLGVIFVASGSWLIVRIGAATSAILVIGGQMVSGVVLDFVLGASPVPWASLLGVTLIITGTVLIQTRPRAD